MFYVFLEASNMSLNWSEQCISHRPLCGHDIVELGSNESSGLKIWATYSLFFAKHVLTPHEAVLLRRLIDESFDVCNKEDLDYMFIMEDCNELCKFMPGEIARVKEGLRLGSWQLKEEQEAEYYAKKSKDYDMPQQKGKKT